VGQSNNGTTTAAIVSGGLPGPGAAVEQFDGSSWSETTEINTARDGMWGFGTSTAQIIAGSTNSPVVAKTESWNGSTWTEEVEQQRLV
jgi:hypothetical protein